MNKWWIIGPIIAMALLTPFTPWLDTTIAQSVYDTTHFSENAFARFFYDYGRFPAIFLFFVAFIVLAASYFSAALERWRPAALMLTLLMIIGPGLVVNALLKDHWGRPRPRQTIEYGGTEPFRPYYMPNFSTPISNFKSFPCGHCSMGFYFFGLALVGSRYKMRWLFITGMVSTLVLGISLSIARILQGGHYLSDVLMSALIMWLVAVAIDRFINE